MPRRRKLRKIKEALRVSFQWTGRNEEKMEMVVVEKVDENQSLPDASWPGTR